MEHLSKQQVTKGLNWFLKHKDQIQKIMLEIKQSYPPTLLEDRDNPNLWKPAHWNWFIQEHTTPPELIDENKDGCALPFFILLGVLIWCVILL